MELPAGDSAHEADCSSCQCPSLSLDDDEIVRRVREGETPLFEVLMRRYNQRLYRVARSIVFGQLGIPRPVSPPRA